MICIDAFLQNCYILRSLGADFMASNYTTASKTLMTLLLVNHEHLKRSSLMIQAYLDDFYPNFTNEFKTAGTKISGPGKLITPRYNYTMYIVIYHMMTPMSFFSLLPSMNTWV